MIQGHLKTSDVATADLVAQRLQPPKDEVAQAVLEVDEAAEVLEPDDRKLITADQEKVVSENQSFESFAEEYRQRRKKINLYLEQQARKQPASKRSKTSAPTLPSHITQASAKFLFARRQVMFHLERPQQIGLEWPLPTFQAGASSSQSLGEEGAMKRVLCMLWRQWAKKMGKNFPDDCVFYEQIKGHDLDLPELGDEPEDS